MSLARETSIAADLTRSEFSRQACRPDLAQRHVATGCDI